MEMNGNSKPPVGAMEIKLQSSSSGTPILRYNSEEGMAAVLPMQRQNSSNWLHSLNDCMPAFIPRTSLYQKVGAEIIGTFILVFAGCGAAIVDAKSHGAITHFGIAASFGLVVMIMIYSIGHISGAHMNPAVTLAFAGVRHFPWKHVPAYIGAQLAAAISAAFCLKLILNPAEGKGVTLPAGTEIQSFVLEIIISFILMFVISAVATDTRAIGELAGLAVGSTIALNVIFAGPICGASMNPARSIGPAIAANNYKGIWLYLVGPTVGAVAGACSYNLIRLPEEDAAAGLDRSQTKRSKSFRRSNW